MVLLPAGGRVTPAKGQCPAVRGIAGRREPHATGILEFPLASLTCVKKGGCLDLFHTRAPLALGLPIDPDLRPMAGKPSHFGTEANAVLLFLQAAGNRLQAADSMTTADYWTLRLKLSELLTKARVCNPRDALSLRNGALSVEGVPSLRSGSATGLVSRHWSEFGTSRACRFCNVQAGAQAIFGALKCLQRASKRP